MSAFPHLDSHFTRNLYEHPLYLKENLCKILHIFLNRGDHPPQTSSICGYWLITWRKRKGFCGGNVCQELLYELYIWPLPQPPYKLGGHSDSNSSDQDSSGNSSHNSSDSNRSFSNRSSCHICSTNSSRSNNHSRVTLQVSMYLGRQHAVVNDKSRSQSQQSNCRVHAPKSKTISLSNKWKTDESFGRDLLSFGNLHLDIGESRLLTVNQLHPSFDDLEWL